MNRKYTEREGAFADIGSASTYRDQYYYATDVGLYYYSNGTAWTVTVFDKGNSLSNLSGSISAGSTAQLITSADTSRKFLFFQNTSGVAMYVGIGYVPTADNGILVASGGGILRFETFVPTDAVRVFCATSSSKFVCLVG